MPALRIHAGPTALRHIKAHGLRPEHVRVVPAAAGGPKGLILGPIDRFIFGEWLTRSGQPVDLVGASIGAWRMATACLPDPVAGFMRLEADYIAQDYVIEPGRKRPTAAHVSERFGGSIRSFYDGQVAGVLAHPRYRLHVLTSRGRHLLGREHSVGTPLGYLGAFLSNGVHRKAMGAWLERVVFSGSASGTMAALPFTTSDYRTRQVALTAANFGDALQASCSIPFVLSAVHDIAGAPRGAYWDGGITDYHLHLNYAAGSSAGLVLYPHFQRAVIPGWLDKGLKWRHNATPFLDTTIVLSPDPAWVASLPNRKLPDRSDFTRYGTQLAERQRVWRQAVAASEALAEEFRRWCDLDPDQQAHRVEPL